MEIYLRKDYFSYHETPLIEWEGLKAVLYKYETGVEAIRLENEIGHLVLLPYYGQMIWDANFGNRRLTMWRNGRGDPRYDYNLLDSYGGFLFHCGARQIGSPGPGDHHPIHGDLPTAPYTKAWLVAGKDEAGPYIGLTGIYHHLQGFDNCYNAKPLVKIYAGSSLFEISMTIENLSGLSMDLMYMMHVNYRLAIGGRLVQTSSYSPDALQLRIDPPSHLTLPSGYQEMIERFKNDPKTASSIGPNDYIRPEVCFFQEKMHTDADGWARVIQIHPDKTADFIRYKPVELDHSTRWISKYEDIEGVGLAFPSTANPLGYSAAKKLGQVKSIEPHGVWKATVVTGFLNAADAAREEQFIEKVKNDCVLHDR